MDLCGIMMFLKENMMENKMNVMVVGFGDWRENWVKKEEWCGWNVWFVMKKMIDDMVEGFEWNKSCGDEGGEIDWVNVMKSFRMFVS